MKHNNQVTKRESQLLAISAAVLTTMFITFSDKYEMFAYFYFASLIIAAIFLKYKYAKSYKKLLPMIYHFMAYSVLFYLVIMAILLFTTDWGPN